MLDPSLMFVISAGVKVDAAFKAPLQLLSLLLVGTDLTSAGVLLLRFNPLLEA